MFKTKPTLVALAVLTSSFLAGCATNSSMSQELQPSAQMRVVFEEYQSEIKNVDSSTFGIVTDLIATAMQNLDLKYLAQIEAIDRSKLSRADQIYYDLFVFDRKIGIQGSAFQNARFGSFTMPLSHFDNYISYNAEEVGAVQGSIEEYTNNLEKIKEFNSWVLNLKAQFSLGNVEGIQLPKLLISRFIANIEATVLNNSFESLNFGLKDLQKNKSKYSDEFIATYTEALMNCETSINSLVSFMKDDALLQARGTGAITDKNIGWGALPNGHSWYKWHLDRNSTTGKPANELHKIGKDLVADAKSEMTRVAAFVATKHSFPVKAMYKAPDAKKASMRSFDWIDEKNGNKVDLPEFFAYLNSEQFFYGRDGNNAPITNYKEDCSTASNVQACQFALKDYYKFKKDANKVIKGYFTPVKTDYKILPTTKAQEPYAGVASYDQKVFTLNTDPDLSLQKWNISTLLLHEAAPGHHFQFAYAAEYPAPNKPDYASKAQYTAYEEGWALYTEWLGSEMGIYGDLNKAGKPTFKNATGMCTDVKDFTTFQGDIYKDVEECNALQYFGSLNEAQLRSMRLVVDTGIHANGWSIKNVQDYLHANSALGKGDINSESYRYAAYVGQAVSYKSGYIVIKDLLAKAQSQLGDKFSWAEFHDQILKYGAQPMTILETSVGNWIEENK